MTEYIHADSKWGDFEVFGEDGTLESAALKLLKERVEDGFWYDDEDQAVAEDIAKYGSGEKAWKFLESRRDHEYEWVEARSS